MNRKDLLLLLLAVGIIIGYTYSLDTPQALQVPLRKEPYNFSTTYFNLMYFSTFLLIGLLEVWLGVFIDRSPIKFALILMLCILTISQIIIALMFQFQPPGYKFVILVFRAIFGLCGQGLYVLQCVIMSIFATNQYQMLAGLALALPFAFDALNSLVTTSVYDSTKNLPLTWYISCAVCFISLGCGIWMNKSIIGQYSQQKGKGQKQTGLLKELKSLGKQFWVLNMFIFFAEGSLGSFNDNLNQLIVERFGVSYPTAGKLLLIPFMAMGIFTFILGWMLRRKPSIRRMSTLISTSLYLVAHVCLYLLPNAEDPSLFDYFVITFFLFSMSFNFAMYYASLSTSVSFVVDANLLGTAWGTVGSSIGLSQCLIPLIFIPIINSDPDISISYQNLNKFGILLAAIPVGFSLWINYWDNYKILDTYYAKIQDYKNEENRKSLLSNAQNADDIIQPKQVLMYSNTQISN